MGHRMNAIPRNTQTQSVDLARFAAEMHWLLEPVTERIE